MWRYDITEAGLLTLRAVATPWKPRRIQSIPATEEMKMSCKRCFSLLVLVLVVATSSGVARAQAGRVGRAAKGGGIVGRIIVGVLGNPKTALAPMGARCVRPRSPQRTPRRVLN